MENWVVQVIICNCTYFFIKGQLWLFDYLRSTYLGSLLMLLQIRCFSRRYSGMSISMTPLVSNKVHLFTGCRHIPKGKTLGISFFEKSYLWFLRRGQKRPKSDFRSQFSMSKIEGISLNFFFIEKYYFRRPFFVKNIFL